MHRLLCIHRISCSSILALSRRSILDPSSLPAKNSLLPPRDDPHWVSLGSAVVQTALQNDTGPEAFAEVMQARKQLEIIVQSCGYNFEIFPFGGITIMKLLEVGGDVDFTAFTDVEPTPEEAGEIVARWAREMRRLGMYVRPFPKARVPVLKADRRSHAVPGSLMHSNSRCGLFQFARPLTPAEQDEFERNIEEEYLAEECTWVSGSSIARIAFPDTNSLLVALTHFCRLGSVEVVVRMPEDPKEGPELFRFPFDLCISTTGLQNSFTVSRQLNEYKYARHLLLALKRWGRGSGIVNTMEGFLASYAITIMLAHFLATCGVVKLADTNLFGETSRAQRRFPKEIEYVPLAGVEEGDMAQLGYLFASFFEYYSTQFDYKNDVVCTSRLGLKKDDIGWTEPPDVIEHGDAKTDQERVEKAHPKKPPYNFFAIKDPFSPDNIARNLTKEAQEYVKKSCLLASESIVTGLKEPEFLVSTITEHPPRPVYSPSIGTFGLPDGREAATQDAYKMLRKLEFSRRRDNLQRFGQNTMRKNTQVRAAQDVTRRVVSWLKQDVFDEATETVEKQK